MDADYYNGLVLVGFMVFNATFNQYFSYIVAVSFIGGENRWTWRKPPKPVASH
jgi:hypothetical protein